MKRLLRIVFFLAVAFVQAQSSIAANDDCILSNDPAVRKESGPETEVPVGIESGGCAENKAKDLIGQNEPTAHVTDPSSVVGKTWQWEASITADKQLTVPNPERYTINLMKDGKLQARFDCNRGGGDYKISEGSLTFGPMFSTRMACPPDSLDGQFMSDLAKVNSFFVQDGKLFLKLEGDNGVMHFFLSP